MHIVAYSPEKPKISFVKNSTGTIFKKSIEHGIRKAIKTPTVNRKTETIRLLSFSLIVIRNKQLRIENTVIKVKNNHKSLKIMIKATP